MFRFERRLDLLLDDLEVGVGDGAELLERVEAEIAAEAEGLRATDAEQSRERKLSTDTAGTSVDARVRDAHTSQCTRAIATRSQRRSE